MASVSASQAFQAGSDDESIRRTFWRITGEADIDRITTLFAPKSIYIADGHHRLAVSMKLGLRYTAMYLTNMCSDGIVILPYHRIVRMNRPRPLAQLLKALSDHFKIMRVEGSDDGALRSMLGRISSSNILAFVLYSRDDPNHMYLATQQRLFVFSQFIHESMKKLKVNLIHGHVIRQLLGIEEQEISFLKDGHEAVDLVKKHDFDLAFLVPPVTVQEVKEIAENRLYMPPKSTYFYPKILTGLVMHKYE